MNELQEDSLVSVQRMNYGQQKLYKVKDQLVSSDPNRSTNMSGNRGGSAGPQHSSSQSPTPDQQQNEESSKLDAMLYHRLNKIQNLI